MLKRFSTFLILIVSLIGFSGCGGDDDEPEMGGSSSSFTVNGVKAGKLLNAVCEITIYPSYLGGGREMALGAYYIFGDEGIITFSMAAASITDISDIETGMDLTDDIIIYAFHPMNEVHLREDYEVLDGSAVVKKITGNAVVVKFSNFTFSRDLVGYDDTITINGEISYEIND